jgi:hypothetical protein
MESENEIEISIAIYVQYGINNVLITRTPPTDFSYLIHI